ncbi:MAG: rod shape-determining protein MreD [Acidobacteria bacterium]|jgi:rod shape-determining protein MreD|nr:rod shape-determining protein MreD [Acidobacteriota bacterium]
MKVLLTVAVALVLQMALARFAIGGRWVFDLVLVGVVYAALRWGPVAGMWTGTIGGLLQDALGAGVVGIGGLAKTVVGVAAGVAGAQFMVARPLGGAEMVAAATVAHRLMVLGLFAVVDQDWFGVPWTAMLIEAALNATAGLVALHVTDRLPGAVRETRARRRPSLSRRNW